MTGKEKEPDLNRLDDAELEREEKRNFLRWLRERRKREQDRADREITHDKINDGIRIALAVGLLVIAALPVLSVVVGAIYKLLQGFGGGPPVARS
jgi:ribosomal protein S12 methylthiotransferase accessory factor YcaO